MTIKYAGYTGIAANANLDVLPQMIPAGRTVATLSAYLDNNKVVNLRDYGLLPSNTGAQNVAAFNLALSLQTAATTFFVPAGFYNFNGVITIPTFGAPFVILGEGMYVSRFSYTGVGALTSMFGMAVPGQRYEGMEFHDFQVLGNGLLGAVVDTYSGTFANRAFASHTIVSRVQVQGTTAYCFRLADCYSSTFRDCQFFSNTGGGIALVGGFAAQNNITIQSCAIYANSGIGVLLQSGLGVTIHSCGIETNAAAGIVAYDMRGLNIVDGYCERNGAVGYTFTTPVLGIKADIILSASSTLGVLDLTGNMESVRIVGNQITGYNTGTANPGVDCFVFTNKGDKLTIEHNQVYEPAKYTSLVQIYDPTGAAVVSPVRIAKNTIDTVTFSGIVGATSPAGAHWIEIERAGSRVNYISQDFNQFAAQSGTTGTRVKSGTAFGLVGFGGAEFPTFDLTTGDFVWGPIITPVPDDLKSTWVYFGVWYKVGAAAGSNVQLQLSGNSDTVVTDVANQTWQFKSVATLYGSAPANIAPFLKKLGASSAVTIGPMIVARVGDPARLFPTPNEVTLAAGAVPSVGTWRVGRRVVNSAPAVASPKAWVCTVAGTPGTWVSEGNL